jgi:tetratricopeptide (TPR) repeat protein
MACFRRSKKPCSAVAGDAAIPAGKVFEIVLGLIRKSMIAIVPGSRAQRYRLLETTRVFMLELLAASADAEVTRRRHAQYVLHALEKAKSESETTSDEIWHERYRLVLDDVRSALEWALDQNSDEAVTLAGASWPLWRELSLRGEGQRRLGEAMAKLRRDTPPALEARLRRGLADMWCRNAAVNTSYQEIVHAVALYRKLGERPELGCALTELAFALLLLGRIKEAEQAILEALGLLETSGRPRTLATAYSTQLCIEATLGRFDLARAAGEKAAHLCEMTGAERSRGVVAGNLIELSIETGDLDEAVAAARRVARQLTHTSHSDDRGFVLGLLTAALTAQGDLDAALEAGRDAAPLLRDSGVLFWLFDHLALRAALAERAKDAAHIAGYADAVHETFGRPREPMGRRAVGRLDALLQDAISARQIAEFRRTGAQMTEEQALGIALSS